MSIKEQIYVAVFLLAVFLYHYIRLSLRVRRIEKGIIYAVSDDNYLRTAVTSASRELDGTLDYDIDFFKDGDLYSLSDAREIAKICEGAVVNKHTKEIIEDYRK